MKNIFYDALCNGMTPAQLADEMNVALREYEAMTEKAKREKAAENAADAMNTYIRLVDPDWEDLDAADIEAIAYMSTLMRGAIGGILEVMFGSTEDPAPAQAADIHVAKPKMSAEDQAIADFLSFLGV